MATKQDTKNTYSSDPKNLNETNKMFFKVIKDIFKIEDKDDYLTCALLPTFATLSTLTQDKAFGFILHQIRLSVYILRGGVSQEVMKKLGKEVAEGTSKINVLVDQSIPIADEEFIKV